jgi:hypothetical protein
MDITVTQKVLDALTTGLSISANGYKNYAEASRFMQRRIKWATAFFLTERAMMARELAVEEVMPAMFTVRDKRFLQARLRVDKAMGRQEPLSQVAKFYSTTTSRFSGWEEQIEGGKLSRTAAMLQSRRGAEMNKIAPSARLKPGNAMPTDKAWQPPTTFQRKSKLGKMHTVKSSAPSSQEHKAFVMLRKFSRDRKLGGKPFILTGHAKLEAGVWVLKGSFGRGKWPQPRLLRAFGTQPEVKQRDWRVQTLRVLNAKFDTAAMWRSCWNRSANKGKK